MLNFVFIEQTVTYWWQLSGLPVYTEVWMSLQITNQCMTNWRPSRSSLWLRTKDSARQTAPSSSLCLKTQNCPTMVNFYLNFQKTSIGICIYKLSNHPHNMLEQAPETSSLELLWTLFYLIISKTRGMKRCA